MNILSFSLIIPFLGQTTTVEATTTPAARLEIMKKSVAPYVVHHPDDRGKVYRLKPDPVLRFTNTVGNTQDGAVFFWLDEHDRPVVAGQVFVRRDERWFLELCSLSCDPVVADAMAGAASWMPSRGGVEFKPLPGAPKPGETAEARSRQIRELSRDFTVEDSFRGHTWHSLRMLTKPLARYSNPGDGLIDGALFCYVLTTDPESFLFLEARAGKDGPAWYYAIAPMSVYGLRASWKGKEVWSLERAGRNARNPSSPYHVRELQPAE